MATKFKKGDVVKVSAVIPEGPVQALRMDEEGNFFYLIEWDTPEGKQQRWFDENDLVAG
jgi:uncharacterized protein YodC (DUF2158 family)